MARKKKVQQVPICFPEEKLEALEYSLAEKQVTLEQKIDEYVLSLYEKYVPVQLRNYLDAREKKAAGGGQENDPDEGAV